MKKNIIVSIVLLIIALISIDVSYATDFDKAGNDKWAYDSLDLMKSEVSKIISNVMKDKALVNASNMLFTVFALTLIFITMFNYVHGKADYGDIITIVLLIGITKVLMVSYDTLTSGIWEWFNGMADGIQFAATGTTKAAQIPMWIAKVSSALMIKETSADSWIPSLPNLAHIFAAVVIFLFSLLLSIMAFLASAWGVWGFSIAKMIGWFFIPFIMFERLSFIFDGWLKFFLGFPIYVLIARINILLMAVTLNVYFSIGTKTFTAASITKPIEITLENISDVTGLAGIMFIGILALLSTGSFAAAIIGGASGFGGGIRGLASSARALR